MLSAEKNRLITETGPDTPAGGLLRRYWQPAALSEELDAARPIVEVRLLGEDLVLFRDGRGGLGLIAESCPHRGASMAYGVVRPDGLECFYHGWIFDCEGKCRRQPAEPADSKFRDKVTTAPSIARPSASMSRPTSAPSACKATSTTAVCSRLPRSEAIAVAEHASTANERTARNRKNLELAMGKRSIVSCRSMSGRAKCRTIGP